MQPRQLWRDVSLAVLGLALAASLAFLAVSAPALPSSRAGVAAVGVVAVVFVASVAYVGLLADPAYIFTLGIVLSPFAGNWQQVHIPGVLAPDRC